MDILKELTEYNNSVSFKSTIVGGYNKKDVNKKINELLDLFKNYAKEEEEKQRAKEEEYELKLQTAQVLTEELNRKLSLLMKEQQTVEKEKEQMQTAYKAYCSNILKQYSESLCSLSTEFAQILDNLSDAQKQISDIEAFDRIELKVKEKYIEKQK